MESDNPTQPLRPVDQLLDQTYATLAEAPELDARWELGSNLDTLDFVLSDYGESYTINRIATIEAFLAAVSTLEPKAVPALLEAVHTEEQALRKLLLMVSEHHEQAAHEIDEHQSPETLAEDQLMGEYELYARQCIIDDQLWHTSRIRKVWERTARLYVLPTRIYYWDGRSTEGDEMPGWWSSSQEFAGHTYREALKEVAKLDNAARRSARSALASPSSPPR